MHNKNISRILFFSLGLTLILIRGIYPTFTIDVITISLYLILSIPILFDYLEQLELPGGTRFVFRRKLVKLQINFEKNKEKLKETLDEKTKKMIKKKKEFYKTFDFSIAENLIETDPSLGIASIRMEIERKLRLAYSVLMKQDSNKIPLRKIIEELENNKIIFDIQMNLLNAIISICNHVIHGTKISKDEAKRVLSIVEELNYTFSIGYSICFEYNKEFEKHGLVCPWEHCIEFMPLEKRNKKSCPIFGHDCPGGEKQVRLCKKDNQMTLEKNPKIKNRLLS